MSTPLSTSSASSFVIYTVWVINKSGGLVFFKEFNPFHSRMTSNDALVIASTLQSIHAITIQLFPDSPGFSKIVYNSGDVDSSASFTLHLFQTPTGLKFMCTTASSPSPTGKHTPSEGQSFLKRVYELYTDYALKNYYYTPEMPIRCEQFDYQLDRLVKKQ
jgi:trafficking protein particle complex subunit 4